MVTFVAGYIAGVFCAIVSHPADSIVSKLNANPGGGVVSAAKELGGSLRKESYQLLIFLCSLPKFQIYIIS